MIHLIEFRTKEGVILQRVDHISTILESTVPHKGGEKTVYHLLLANNVRVEIIGETRETLKQRLHSSGGQVVIIVELPKEEEPAPPVVAEPVGNAVVPPPVDTIPVVGGNLVTAVDDEDGSL